MTQITTVTPNPALDLSTSVEQVLPFSKLRCSAPQRDPGGGGINVARVIQRLGGDVTAVFPSGGVTGDLLCRLLQEEGVPSRPIRTAEETREDFTIFETSTRQQYRFVLPGARLSEPEWRQSLDLLRSLDPAPDYIVASGSLPPGMPETYYAQIAEIATRMNAKAVVDTSGPALQAALDAGLHLIKPNLREFQQLVGLTTASEPALVTAGRELIASGRVEIIALSLGPDGALLMTRDEVLRAQGLPITPQSVVGAGDSFAAALIWSLAKKDPLETALRLAVAAGSAALLRPGTELCHPDEVFRLAAEISIARVASPG